MPFQNIIQLHFTDAEKAACNTLMNQLEALLHPKLYNLSEEENKRYGVVKEHNKLLIDKVMNYHNSQPALGCPDVDWVEFDMDAKDRFFLENIALRLEGIMKASIETKRLYDYDNYQNALLDYKYTQYKVKTQAGSGYDSKEAELKQFFPATGNKTPKKAKDTDTNA